MGAKQLLGGIATVASAATYYHPTGGVGAPTNEAFAKVPEANAGTYSELRVKLSVAPGSGKSRTFALRKNGSTTAITLTISDTATEASDTTHSVTVAQDDLVNLIETTSGSPTTAVATWTIVRESDTDALHIGGNLAAAPSNSFDFYSPFAGGQFSNLTFTTQYESIISTPGTISSFRVHRQVTISFGGPGTVYIYRNGSSEASSAIALTAGTGIQSVGSLNISVSDGDGLTFWRDAVTSAGTWTSLAWSMEFTPTTSGDSPFFINGAKGSSGHSYGTAFGVDSGLGATEYFYPMPEVDAVHMTSESSSSTASTATVAVNNVDSSLATSSIGTSPVSDTSTASYAADDELSLDVNHGANSTVKNCITLQFPSTDVIENATPIAVDATMVTAARLLTIAATPILVELALIAPALALAEAAAVMGVDVASVAPAELLAAPASVVSVQATSVQVTTTVEHSRSASPILVDATLVTATKALAAGATPIAVGVTSVASTLLLAAGASPIVVQAAIVAAEKALTAAAAVIQVQAQLIDAVAFTGILRTASPIAVQATSVAPATSLSSQATPIAVEAALVAVSELLAASASAIGVQAASVAPERLLTASAAVIAVQAAAVAPAKLLTAAAAVIGVDVASVAADPAVAVAAAAILVEAGLVSQDLALAYQAAVTSVQATMVDAPYSTGNVKLATPILVEATFVAASHLRWWERVSAELMGLDRATIRAGGVDRATIGAEGVDRASIRLKGIED